MSVAIYLLAFLSNAMKHLITKQIIFSQRKKLKKQNVFFFFFCFTYQRLFAIQQKFLININIFSLLGQSVVDSPTNKKVPGSIQDPANSSYTQYSQGNLNCSVSYWELKFHLKIQPRNRFLWSRATSKGFDSLVVQLICQVSPTTQLLSYL